MVTKDNINIFSFTATAYIRETLQFSVLIGYAQLWEKDPLILQSEFNSK